MERTSVHSRGPSKTRDVTPYGFLPTLPRQGRGRTTQRVQDIIRDAIVSLAFTPGEFIQKDAVCRRLGVSRFPVSEALGRLADEGFVEVLPQRGTRVTRIDIVSCRQAMFIRQALEGEAMRVIAPRATDTLIDRLQQNLAEQKLAIERGNAVWFAQLDHGFHDLLLSELGYDHVRTAVEAARGSLNRTRMFLLRTAERQTENHREHTDILDALKAHDADAARRAMKAHLDRSLDEIEAGAADNPDVFALAPASP